jgi:arsenate reductase (glutaredoxin)
MEIVIYHYPKCRKSRAALEYLNNQGYSPAVILYVDEGITSQTLKELFGKLGHTPLEMVRKQEEFYKETYKGEDITDEEWYKILSDYPKLIRRPIVLIGDHAVVADPPQLMQPYLKK